MAYDGTNNFSQWDVTRPAGTELGDILAIAIQEVKRVTQTVVENEHNSDGSHKTGFIVSGYLAAGSVATAAIADGAVTAAKLAANIVNSSALADGAVGTNQLADGAVSTAKIAVNAVGNSQIANSAVTSGKLGGGVTGGFLIGQAGGGFLQFALSGALSVDPTSGVVTLTTPISTDIAVIQDIKADGTDGGTFTSGALRLRDLNSLNDPAGFVVALSGNKFTLPIGKYVLWAEVPAYVTGDHQAIVYDETNSVIKLSGSSCSNGNLAPLTSRSVIMGYLDYSMASSDTQLDIQHQCDTTEATDGFGKASSFTVANEVYTQIMIIKIA